MLMGELNTDSTFVTMMAKMKNECDTLERERELIFFASHFFVDDVLLCI